MTAVTPTVIEPVPEVALPTRARAVRTRQRVLRADLLLRPAEYARPLRQHWINRLVREWNRRKVGVLLVSQRPDGTYRALTGNHRVASRLQDGEPDFSFDCLVYENLSLQEEATIYLAQDDERLRHTVADDFPAMLVNDDPTAKGVERVLDAVGLEIAPYGMAGFKRTRVRAVSALLNAYEVSGPVHLETALRLLKEEWAVRADHDALTNPKKTVFSEATVGSLAAFLRLYDTQPNPVDVGWLRKAMAGSSLGAWEDAWLRHRQAARSKPQGGVALLYGCLAWIDLYNYGRRERNRLDDMVARRSSKTLQVSRKRRSGASGGRP